MWWQCRHGSLQGTAGVQEQSGLRHLHSPRSPSIWASSESMNLKVQDKESSQRWKTLSKQSLRGGESHHVRGTRGFPGGSDGSRICLQCRRPRFGPWVGKIPWRREWQPTPVFFLGKFHAQRSLAGCSAWDGKELDTTEQLTLSLSRGPEEQSRSVA